VTVAVLRQLAERGAIGDDETVVAYVTGDGLKTIDAVASSVSTVPVPADVDAVDAALAAVMV
jgi:threonine synthase